jgi:hypothetical protein
MYRSAEGIPHAQYCNNVSFISLSCIYYVVNLYPVSSSKMYLNICVSFTLPGFRLTPTCVLQFLNLRSNEGGKIQAKCVLRSWLC